MRGFLLGALGLGILYALLQGEEKGTSGVSSGATTAANFVHGLSDPTVPGLRQRANFSSSLTPAEPGAKGTETQAAPIAPPAMVSA